MPDDATNVAAGDPTPTDQRGGEDVRRRGWFWHWNSIITQFAPLVGLKGVGLLNSYTVWTDRREESPTRGYAFPSQQSEADFYGEDRAELITVNKILVALDLIEIRKEMVVRVDERGRRWRVPHNLYRVKDHPDGFALTPEDVLRVVELAGRDSAVYRYVRRIFSSRFAPIDRDNVWHQILPIVREHGTWQRLAARAQREEDRASARTKAGHASRARAASTTPAKTQAASTPEVDSRDSKRRGKQTTVVPANDGSPPSAEIAVAPGNDGSQVDVAPSNTGLGSDVDQSSNGLTPAAATTAAGANTAHEEVVDETNTTYHQVLSTTTTTTTGDASGSSLGLGAGPDPRDAAGPLPEPSAEVLGCFEAANDRDATPLERELLAELEATFAAAATAAGATGRDWVVAAIREAVNSGSRFVAPKRVREILNRWATQAADPLRARAAGASPVVAATPLYDVALPRGRRGAEVWQQTLRLLAQVMDSTAMERFFAGSAISAYRGGLVTVEVATPEAAESLGGEYADLLARKLGEVMGRSVRLRVQPAATAPEIDPDAPPAASPMPVSAPPTMPAPVPVPASPPAPPRFVFPGGLTNLQVWAVAQDELAGRLTPANFEAWVRPAQLIGRAGDGAVVIGVPSAFAQRRLQPLLPEIQSVLSDILGPVEARVAVAHEWLRLNASPDADA